MLNRFKIHVHFQLGLKRLITHTLIYIKLYVSAPKYLDFQRNNAGTAMATLIIRPVASDSAVAKATLCCCGQLNFSQRERERERIVRGECVRWRCHLAHLLITFAIDSFVGVSMCVCLCVCLLVFCADLSESFPFSSGSCVSTLTT